MTEERTKELLTAAIRHIPARDRQSLYNTLHGNIGMSNEEILECGMEHLRDQFVYEWAPDMLERLYAEKLDALLPQPDVYTTSKWMEYLRELAGNLESSFEKEAEDLLCAFRGITRRHSPQAVAQVYETIHLPNNALLPREIVMAADRAELGATVQELGEMAANGEFEGGTVPKEETVDPSMPSDGMEAVEVWLHGYQLEALEEALVNEGSCVEDRMQDYLVELYSELVQKDVQTEIRRRIDAEHGVPESRDMEPAM